LALIRDATAHDAAALAELWTDSARAGFETLLPPGHALPSFEPVRLLAVLDDERVQTLVADCDGELIGQTTFGVSRDSDAAATDGEVRSLFVRPAVWRGGVGTALLRRALEGLATMGFAEATLWSFADNQRANAFYERHGFSRDGSEKHEEVWAGLLEVRYRRALP
jgi:GNAT superfamily N-acetyltransferase